MHSTSGSLCLYSALPLRLSHAFRRPVAIMITILYNPLLWHYRSIVVITPQENGEHCGSTLSRSTRNTHFPWWQSRWYNVGLLCHYYDCHYFVSAFVQCAGATWWQSMEIGSEFRLFLSWKLTARHLSTEMWCLLEPNVTILFFWVFEKVTGGWKVITVSGDSRGKLCIKN